MEKNLRQIIEKVENDEYVKKILISQLDSFINKIDESIRPQKILFIRWADANREGRQSFFYEGNLNEDFETRNKTKVWLYIFPEHREDYLIERIWQRMYESGKEELTLKIKFTSESRPVFSKKEKIWNINLPNNFLNTFFGIEINQKIKEVIADIRTNKEEADLVKAARLLRYDKNLNEYQLTGVRQGYKKWVQNKRLKNTLLNIFKKLYNTDIDSPLMIPEGALRFLFMWQNFSVNFLGFSNVFMYFVVNNSLSARTCMGFFWKDSIRKGWKFDKEAIEIPKKVENEIDRKVGITLRSLENANNDMKRMQQENEKEQITMSSQGDLWIPIKKRFEDLWEKIGLDSISIDSLMELTGKLAFSQHEGKSNKFYFIAGTEQVWPAVAEIVSIDFYSQKELKKYKLNRSLTIEFNPDIYKQICEANYSIFQVPRVVGFFNIKIQQLYKIYRLTGPSEEECRLLEDPVVDEDDFFCWTISKIFNGTGKKEKAYIVGTKGDGIVRIYGLNGEDGELLLIWDVGKGKLHPPINENKKEQEEIIKIIKNQLGLNGDEKFIRKIIRAIRKISGNTGEGATLILAKDNTTINKYLAKMELLVPSWIRTLSLHDPSYILHAAYITDGACLITKSNRLKITPRQAIYSFSKEGTWELENIINDSRFKERKGDIIKKQLGRGSKTHASANISTHPEVNPNLKNPRVVIISISADGPIKIWPHEFLKKDKNDPTTNT